MAKKYTQKEFEEKIRLVHNDTIDLSGFVYVNSQTKGKCKCRVCGHEWESRPYSLIAGHGCRRCYDKRNSERRLQDIISVNERIHKSGTKVTIIDEYVNTKTKCLVKCDECGYVWRTVPNQLYFGHGCPKCNNCWTNRRKTKETFIKEMEELYNGEYSYKIDTDYVRTSDFITFVCPTHGEVRQLVYTHKKGNGCPLCFESGIEKRVRIQLEQHDINYKQWFSEKWLGLQSIDFYLPDINVGIEVQGSQHFLPNEFFGGKEEFEKRVELDKRKKRLCNENNVELIYFLNEEHVCYMNKNDRYFTNEQDLINFINERNKNNF